MKRLTSFGEFWPVYLRAHANPRCRALHYAASIAGIAGLAMTLLTGGWGWAGVGLVSAYAFAWTGHYYVEENVPLTFKHPLWSFAADYRMFGLWLTGQLPRHLRNAGADAA